MPDHLIMSPNLTETRTLLEQVQTSPILGVCFLNDKRQLVEVYEDDPDFREVIAEFYRQRIEQLIRSDRAAQASRRLLGCAEEV